MKKVLFAFVLLVNFSSLAQLGSISGLITTELNEPLPGASITLAGTVRGVQTNAKGTYILKGLKPGQYTIQVSFVGYRTSKREVNIKEGKQQEVNFTLSDVTELQGVSVTAQSGVKGNSFLPQVNEYTITAGKKNEVILLDNLQANLAMNNSRQIFSRTPGISVWESDGSGIQLGVASRGLSPNRSWEFNVRMDGYDITPDPMGYPEAYYTPPMEVVDRIEIIRGASSLQYGPQFGGLMNFVLRKPDLSTKLVVESQNTTGNNGLFSSFNYVGGTAGRLSYTTYYQKRLGNGWRQNSYFNTDHSHGEVSYALSNKLKVGAQLTYMYTQSQQAGGLTDTEFAQNAQQSKRARNWFSNPWFIYALTADYVISADSKLSLKYFGTTAERNSIGFTKAITEVDPMGNRQVDRDFYQTNGLELRYLVDYKLGSWKNTVASGLRYFSGEIKRKQLGVGSNGNGMDFDIQGLYTRDLIFHNTNYAAFAETILRPSERLLMTIGARLEQIETHMMGQSGLSSSGTPLAATPSTRERSFVLLGAGAEYQVSSGTKLYTNIAQAYRPVLASDLLPPATTDVIDPNLSDAKGFNFDLGYRGELGNYLTFDVDYFHLDYDNRVGTISRTNSDGKIYQFRTNLGHSVSKGAEAYIEFSPTTAWLKASKMGNISVFASIAAIQAHYLDFKTTSVVSGKIVESNLAGKSVENAPEKINRYGITYSKKGLSLSWQISDIGQAFADASNTMAANAAATTGLIPAYQVQDVSGSYKFKKYATLKFGVNNLGDSRYFTRRSGGYPGPGILPADGRTWYVGLNVKFVN
ncbi:TonB-dependent receptor [Aquirufa antheringensis]|jgi:Fe(3+) dicitrate transport protein|uniref:TonB-dependent receptor n=1 Tax=Aquirufa antheringensis TaxID=2516559 RepID=A0A4Q9BGG9_9BACT|nr:TonB-dependent receptor [Aquirufa antheringensis]MCZ2484889.1 TonB-dependent receptor [Aquirufa antheringensis]TBH71612.1 TonB-dependent receptor [Aquirufa antheringensis]TBH75197.1 TonB-dependent receptor [Aquirufa antheringensis]